MYSVKLTTDRWKLNNLIVYPNAIVGGGLSTDVTQTLIPQSFSITPVVNVGLATTIYLSSTSNYLNLYNLNIPNNVLDLNQSYSLTGLFTGFATSLITNLSITATGPNGVSLTSTNLTLNPFLVSGFSSDSIIEYGGLNISTSYVKLNAVPIVGFPQTVKYITYDKNITFSDYRTLNNGIQTFTYSNYFNNPLMLRYTGGVIPTNTSFSTSITLNLLSSPNYSTTYSVTFFGVSSNNIYNFNSFTNSATSSYQFITDITYPQTVQFIVYISDFYSNLNQESFSFSLTANNTSRAGAYSLFSPIPKNVKKQTKWIMQGFNSSGAQIGILTQYFYNDVFISGIASGVGYNFFGELGNNIPTIGLGTFIKTNIGTLNETLVKVSSGLKHNLGLTTLGNVYGLGQNIYNQINNTSLPTLSTSYWSICDPINGYTTSQFRDIYASGDSSFFITWDNNLYAVGNNQYNQLGFPSNNQIYCGVTSLVSPNFFGINIYNYRGCLLTADKQANFSLYEFGAQASNDGTLTNGLYNSISKKNITQLYFNGIISSVTINNITQVNVGLNHNIASATWTYTSGSLNGVTSSGLFAWGYNNYLQIGSSPASNSYFSTPSILTKFDNFGMIVPIEYTESFVAGHYYSLVFANGNYYYIGYGTNSLVFQGAWNPPTISTSISFSNTLVDYNTNSQITSPIIKAIKTPSHVLTFTGFGSVYASGTTANLYKQIYYSKQVNRNSIFIQNAPTAFTTSQNQIFYSAPSFVKIIYGNLINTYYNPTNSKILQAKSYVNFYKDSTNDVILCQFSDQVVAFQVVNTGISSILYNFASYYPNNFTIVDVGVGNSFIPFGSSSSNFAIPLVVAGFTSNSNVYTNYILSYLAQYNISNNSFSIVGVQSYIAIGKSPLTTIACGFNEAKQEKITLSTTNYDWVSSNYNICVGFDNGMISVLGDINAGFGTYISIYNPSLFLIYQGNGNNPNAVTAMAVLPTRQENSNPFIPSLALVATKQDSSVNFYGFSTLSLGQFSFYYAVSQVGSLPITNFGLCKYFGVVRGTFSGNNYGLIGLTSQGSAINFDLSKIGIISATNPFSFSGVPLSLHSYNDPFLTNQYRLYFTTDYNDIYGYTYDSTEFEVGLNYSVLANNKLITLDGTQNGVGISYTVDISSNIYQTVFLTTK